MFPQESDQYLVSMGDGIPAHYVILGQPPSTINIKLSVGNQCGETVVHTIFEKRVFQKMRASLVYWFRTYILNHCIRSDKGRIKFLYVVFKNLLKQGLIGHVRAKYSK